MAFSKMRRMAVSRRAQVTYFVVIGVILLLLALAIPSILNDRPSLPRQEQSTLAVQSYVEECMERVGKEALVFVGKQGGYYDLPQSSINNTPYYYFANIDLTPSQNTIEDEIDSYLVENLETCMSGFEDFVEQGMRIEAQSLESNTQILDDQVNIQIHYPLSVITGNSVQTISDFSLKIEQMRLDLIYQMAHEITQDQIGTASLCVSCIVDRATRHDFYVQAQRTGTDSLLITIIDPNSQITDAPYEFSFASKFDEMSCDSIPSYLDENEKASLVARCLELKLDKVNA